MKGLWLLVLHYAVVFTMFAPHVEPMTKLNDVLTCKARAAFTLVTQRPYCPGRPKELCFTTLSLAMETIGMRLSVVKQSFFGPLGQYGRRVTRANSVVFKLSFNLIMQPL